MQAEEERGPEEVKTELSVVQFEGPDGDLAGGGGGGSRPCVSFRM
jgi:hypothetical protein